MRNADLIVVMNRGSIIESGTHNELLEKEGAYYTLVSSQKLNESEPHQSTASDIQNQPTSADVSDHVLIPGPPSISHKEGHATVLDLSSASKHDDEESEREPEKVVVDEEGRDKLNAKKQEELKLKQETEALLKRPLPWGRVFKLNQPEYRFLALGSLGSSANGTVFPLFSLILSRIVTVFGNPDEDERMREVRYDK